MRRYYALLLCEEGFVRLVKARDGTKVLVETRVEIERDRPYELTLEANGNWLRAWLDGVLLFEIEDVERPLTGGSVGLIVEDGCLSADWVTVEPASD